MERSDWGRLAPLAGLAVTMVWAQAAASQDSPSQSRPLAQTSPRWVCQERQKQVCTVNGCQPAPPGAQITLMLDGASYLRCEGGQCDSEPIERIAASGLFTSIGAGDSILFKTVNDGSAYTEIVAHGLTSFVGHGACEPAG